MITIIIACSDVQRIKFLSICVHIWLYHKLCHQKKIYNGNCEQERLLLDCAILGQQKTLRSTHGYAG